MSSAAIAEDERSESSVHIEPAVDVVPANHLKFYLHFPEPMERGDVFRYLRLVQIDEEGKGVAEVPEPFREVELWDETFTRMTLWFHPGRQKPGVNLNVEIGPILEEGMSYRLEISNDWRTEAGQKLAGPIAHVFTAGPLDDDQPDPKDWEVVELLREHLLIVNTKEVLDPESAKKRIRAWVDGEERKILIRKGLPHVNVKRTGWEKGLLLVDPRLEDLAGNSIERPFNLDIEKRADVERATESVEIRFRRSEIRQVHLVPTQP